MSSLELRNLLTVMDTNDLHEMKTMINVGCEFYMQATVPSTDRVCVDVGLGVHVDFSRAEALQFIEEREVAYNGLSCCSWLSHPYRLRNSHSCS